MEKAARRVPQRAARACGPGGRRRRCSTRCGSSTTARRRRSSRSPTISRPDPQSIVIKPFDADDLKDIEKAIRVERPGPGPEQRRQGDPPDGPGDERRAAEEDGRSRSRSWPRTRRSRAATSAATATSTSTTPRRTRRMTEDDRDKGKDEGAGPAQGLRGEDRRPGRQEGEGSDGSSSRPRVRHAVTGRPSRSRELTLDHLGTRRSARLASVPARDTVMRSLARPSPTSSRRPAPTGLTADAGRRQPAAVRRQPPHAAAARAALEEVPREVRRADHQDPARRRRC